MTRLVQTVAVALSLLWSVGVVSAATYTFTPLNFPGAVATDARGVNDLGHVVGLYQSVPNDSFNHSFFFDGTTYTELAVEECGTVDVEAYGINNADEVVGLCISQGFWKSLVTGEAVLLSAPGAVATTLFAINLNGLIGGVARLPDEPNGHGVVTDSTTWTRVDVPGAASTVVAGLNASNAMSGYACSLGCNTSQGFTTPDGVNFALFSYPGATQTLAFKLSDNGSVVGSFGDSTGTHGFIKEGASFQQIDVPDSDATTVYGISPDGTKLVGIFHDATGVHGFLATEATADTTLPVVTVAANPTELWPPNRQMRPVTVTGSITDTGSGVDASTARYTVLDEYGLIQPTGPVSLQPNGSYTFTVQLQASRRGQDQDGRHYTIVVSAKDNAGNMGFASTIITVPHDQGQQAGASLTACGRICK